MKIALVLIKPGIIRLINGLSRINVEFLDLPDKKAGDKRGDRYASFQEMVGIAGLVNE